MEIFRDIKEEMKEMHQSNENLSPYPEEMKEMHRSNENLSRYQGRNEGNCTAHLEKHRKIR